jgi:hypothetical protein
MVWCVRTTLTLDDDLATQLQQIQRESRENPLAV